MSSGFPCWLFTTSAFHKKQDGGKVVGVKVSCVSVGSVSILDKEHTHELWNHNRNLPGTFVVNDTP